MKKLAYGLVASLFNISSANAAADPAIKLLEDRTGIVDALYRFGAGQDLDDPSLFESAFAEQATLDFSGPAARLGASMPVLRGRENIVKLIMQTVSHLDTTHTVTNPRVEVNGDRAKLFALVEAQHIPKDKPDSHLLLKNIYKVSLVRERGQWLIENMKIDNVWYTGESEILFPK